VARLSRGIIIVQIRPAGSKSFSKVPGRIAADILAERIQKTYADAEGDVALITALPGIAAFDQRAKGFKEQIAAKYGALSIVAEWVADGQATTARQIMAEIITAHSELRGVFASNLIMAQGAAEAVSESKTNKTGDTINLVGASALSRPGTSTAQIPRSRITQSPRRRGRAASAAR
jgi:ABC-type sugar transport system substrate-binding protein